MACPRAAAWVEWVAWAAWTTKSSAYSLDKAINNSRVPKGARLFCCCFSATTGRLVPNWAKHLRWTRMSKEDAGKLKPLSDASAALGIGRKCVVPVTGEAHARRRQGRTGCSRLSRPVRTIPADKRTGIARTAVGRRHTMSAERRDGSLEEIRSRLYDSKR